MSSDANDRSLPANATMPEGVASATPPSVDAEAIGEIRNGDDGSTADLQPSRRSRPIGSQRDPAAYRTLKPRPVAETIGAKPRAPGDAVESPVAVQAPPAPVQAPEPIPTPVLAPVAAEVPPAAPVAPPASISVAVTPPVQPKPEIRSAFTMEVTEDEEDESLDDVLPPGMTMPVPGGPKKFPPPNIRGKLSPDLEDEFAAAMADVSLEEIVSGSEDLSKQTMLEPETKHTGRIITIQREDVFVELGSREQGIVPLIQFPKPPEAGQSLEVRVVRFNAAEGLYELALPFVAADIGDWSDLSDGITVDARITGHNTGGLECEVNHIRGFIPISQIALYRVENLEEFLGQTLTCLVTEANPQRRNLVLSRRALLEREKEEARKLLWESLAPGQVHEGTVRKIMDFGAFVDLGGVDGLLHVSKLGWGRIRHPSDVLQEGQAIKVRIDKIDPDTRRLSLSYRDLLENPWSDAEQKYPVHSAVGGKVSKIMEFGAFVELEPGVEGLVHISELSNKRVFRVTDVVKEGDEVNAMVLSVDTSSRRISLSMKSLIKEEPKVETAAETAEPAPPPKKPQKPVGPLKGGLGRAGGGDKFGLNW
jgi:small subunit ribosomal protein S1